MRAIDLAAFLILASAATPLAAGKSADVTAGRVAYTHYCAVCHGMTADGHGPVAEALRQQPSDLRHLRDRYGNPLSADRIARSVDGRETIIAHGTSEMPVWGERFGAAESEDSEHVLRTDRRILAIAAYLQTLQIDTPH